MAAMAAHACPAAHTGMGKLSPPLLRKNGPACQASDAMGNTSVNIRYHISSCSSTGTLRKNSTYAEHRPRTSALREKRPTPNMVPSTVVMMMPMMATRSVLVRPTRKAFQ